MVANPIRDEDRWTVTPHELDSILVRWEALSSAALGLAVDYEGGPCRRGMVADGREDAALRSTIEAAWWALGHSSLEWRLVKYRMEDLIFDDMAFREREEYWYVERVYWRAVRRMCVVINGRFDESEKSA